MTVKKCSRCRLQKPATREFFPRQKFKGKWVLESVCKECRKEKRKENKEYIDKFIESLEKILKKPDK